MKPILFPATATAFTTQGIGTLDCISCLATEERNGIFEVELKIAADALHFEDLVEGNIIYCIHDDRKNKQPFQIYKRSKPINGVVTVYAEHITYRLSKIVTTPFKSTVIVHALQALKANAVESCQFEFWTDKESSGTFSVDVPCSIRSKLGGEQGSILDAFGGGEFEWDHFTVKLYQHRGIDSGVTLRRGKNITDYTKHTDMTGVYTGIVPYYVDNGNVIMLPEQVLRLPGAPAGYTVAVDLSDKFEEKPTIEQLREAGNTYLNTNAKSGAAINASVSFVALWQTEEYKNVAPLQRVNLCDTVTVVYDQEDTVQTKVIKTVYNVLLERYDEIELGESATNMNSAIKNITETLTGDDMTKSEVQKALDHAAQLITGGLGGYVVFNRNADGHPQEILIMDTDDKETAVNVIRMNRNGIAFSRNGYNGPFNTAWTIDSRFVADFITAGTLNASLIKAGMLAAQNNSRNFWNMLTGEFQLRSDNASTGIDYQNGVLNINASNIKSGTLDASQVNVTNLNASSITSGTLSADRIRGGAMQSFSGLTKFDMDRGRLIVYGSPGYYDGGYTIIDGSGISALYGGRQAIIRASGRSYLNELQLNGNLLVTGTSSFRGNVYNSSGGVQFTSDRNRKKNIATLAVDKAKSFIMRLIPSMFKYKNGTSNRYHHGFIAQDVKEAMGGSDWGVYTELVDEGESVCAIRYDEIIADLVAVVQDQERRISKLEGKT